jgi:SAM-dependent methyltransferase
MKRKFAEQYGNLEQWHWWFRGRQRILETVLERELGNKSPLRMVSVGCGPAEGLAWLARFTQSGGWIVGLDADPLHARHVDSRQEYVVGDLKAAPFASRKFDVVLMLDVLEHLDDDDTGLREAARLLGPGGLLVVTVPALPSLWGGQDVVSNHHRRYTRRTLLRTFREADLPRPHVDYFNSLLFPPIAAVRWTRRAIGQGSRAESDFEGGRPGLINDFLTGLFAFERHLIGRLPMPVGVSLLATARLE